MIKMAKDDSCYLMIPTHLLPIIILPDSIPESGIGGIDFGLSSQVKSTLIIYDLEN